MLIPIGCQKDILQAAAICAGYSKAADNIQVEVSVETNQDCYIVKTPATPPAKLKNLII